MSNLTPDQLRFYNIVADYPRISALWDWKEKALHIEKVNNELAVMSSGERVLTRFFVCLWYGYNQTKLPPFDIVKEISYLERRERNLVAEWIKEPFWP